jgi:predicted kinase
MGNLILLRGLPGSGKTTFAKTLERDLIDTRSVEADDFFVDANGVYRFDPSKLAAAHDYCRYTANLYMDMGILFVVVSNTFTTEEEMQPYFEMAERHDYTVTSLVVENRHGNSSVHNVPEKTIGRMRQRFQIKL